MKTAHILCLVCACAPLAHGAGADESAARTATSVTAAAAGQAVGSKRGTPAAAVAPRRVPSTPPRPTGHLAHGTMDRLHSLLSKPVRVRIPTPSRRRVALTLPARGTDAVARSRSPGVGSAEHTPKVRTFGLAARLPSSKTPPRGATIGGPRATPAARLGGPAVRRSANTAVIDGADVHRRF